MSISIPSALLPKFITHSRVDSPIMLFLFPHLLCGGRAGTSLSSQESCASWLFLGQHASTRARSRGSLARPYMLRLMSLSRFTCPSRGPWPPSAARVLQPPLPCLVGCHGLS